MSPAYWMGAAAGFVAGAALAALVLTLVGS